MMLMTVFTKNPLEIERNASRKSGMLSSRLMMPATSKPAANGISGTISVRRICAMPTMPALYRLSGTISRLTDAANSALPRITMRYCFHSLVFSIVSTPYRKEL